MKIVRRDYVVRRDDNSCIYLVPMIRREDANVPGADAWVYGFRRRLREKLAARRFPLRLPRRGRR